MPVSVDATFVITVVGSAAGILIGMGAITISLFLHTSGHIKAIEREMKDFHVRMAIQDAEFKSFMRQQEEKRTQVLMNGNGSVLR